MLKYVNAVDNSGKTATFVRSTNNNNAMNTTKITGRSIEAGMTIQVCIHTSNDGVIRSTLGKQERGEVLNVERVEYVGGTYRGSIRKVNVSEIVLHTNVGQVHISGRQKVNLLA